MDLDQLERMDGEHEQVVSDKLDGHHSARGQYGERTILIANLFGGFSVQLVQHRASSTRSSTLIPLQSQQFNTSTC